ncbi:MAG: plasmid stabilization system [Frankiales bacterium]|nr:plasmid stabilization system [Frankiales bacterium]
MSAGRYTVLLSPGAKRAIEQELPEAVAVAVVDFLYGPLAEDPHRVGKPLRFQLEGYWSARCNAQPRCRR